MQPPLLLTPEQFASLSSGQSVTFQVGDDQVTLNPPEKRVGRKFTGVDELAESIMAPTDFTCELKPGMFVTFCVRPLESTVAKECDDIGADIKPPKKTIAAAGPRGVATQELDWEDETFLKKRGEVNMLRKAFVLSKGLVGFEIPGSTLEEKSKNLRAKLPPRVIDALFSAITGLTSDPVQQADFS